MAAAAPPGEEPPSAGLQEKMRSHLSLLRAESAILDRVVYKGKNQHRRCPYFKSVLKVRRDLKLLLSADIDDVLINLFRIVDGSDPHRRLRALQGLKNKHIGGKHNFQERLLGVARLLSQMTEPLLVAAVQMSALLARSFFMGYSLIILSLLARIRVLVQQMLLDAVTLYNEVSCLSREKHAVKLIHEGIEAYREYHPPCGGFRNLKCVWEGDKFVLHEEVVSLTNMVECPSLSKRPAILYDVLEGSTVELKSGNEQEQVLEDSSVELKIPFDLEGQLGGSRKLADAKHVEEEDDAIQDEDSSPGTITEVPLVAEINSSQNNEDIEHPCGYNASGSKVAFVSVGKAAITTARELRPEKRLKIQSQSMDSPIPDELEDHFFQLLTSGSKRKIQ